MHATLTRPVAEEAAEAVAAQLQLGILAARSCCHAGSALHAAGEQALRLAGSSKLVLHSGRLLLDRPSGVAPAAQFRAAVRPPVTAQQAACVTQLEAIQRPPSC